MNSRRDILLANAFVCALALLLGAWGLRSVTQARAEAEQARMSYATVRDQLARLANNNDNRATTVIDAFSLVRTTMSAAGIPQNQLNAVRPQGEQQLGSGGAIRRTVAIQLSGMDMASLGRFFAAWHEARSGWQIGDLQMTHRTARSAGSQGSWDISITCFADLMTDQHP